MAKFKSRPRRLIVEQRDLIGAQRCVSSKCLVANAARRQWRKKITVGSDWITVHTQNGNSVDDYVCADPMFRALIGKFDSCSLDPSRDLPATFLMERR